MHRGAVFFHPGGRRCRGLRGSCGSQLRRKAARGVGRDHDSRGFRVAFLPPPPLDLDRSQIPYRDFKVLPPDPHGFDGDPTAWM